MRCRSDGECRSTRCFTDSERCEDEACGSSNLLRAGAPAIALLEALFVQMAWQRAHVNYVLRHTAGVRYRLLQPRALYANGNAYFVHADWPSASELPVLVHNNWLAGFDAKRQRFVDHGMWWAAPSGGARGRLDAQSHKSHKSTETRHHYSAQEHLATGVTKQDPLPDGAAFACIATAVAAPVRGSRSSPPSRGLKERPRRRTRSSGSS